MLEAKVDKGISLKASGNVVDIAIEIGSIINGVYGMIQNEKEKEMFKAAVQRGTEDGSPVWKQRPGGWGVYMENPTRRKGEAE